MAGNCGKDIGFSKRSEMCGVSRLPQRLRKCQENWTCFVMSGNGHGAAATHRWVPLLTQQAGTSLQRGWTTASSAIRVLRQQFDWPKHGVVGGASGALWCHLRVRLGSEWKVLGQKLLPCENAPTILFYVFYFSFWDNFIFFFFWPGLDFYCFLILYSRLYLSAQGNSACIPK